MSELREGVRRPSTPWVRSSAWLRSTLLALLAVWGLSGPTGTVAAQSCASRPPVDVATTSGDPGQLQVTVTAGLGALQAIRFAGGTNAVVEVGGQQRTIPFTLTPTSGSTRQTFTVARSTPGRAMAVGLVAVDGCGDWPIILGTSASAWEPAAPGTGLTTRRVSVRPNGVQGDDVSYASVISADGRYVAFASWAAGLTDGDTNATGDVLVWDRTTGALERASLASDGTQANGYSEVAGLSADGRHVAFDSWATNLVTDDTNARGDIFVRDRGTGLTERVSVATGGGQANDYSDQPTISADGRFVAFASWATDLVSGDTNLAGDVFIRDRQSSTTERISTASDGSQSDQYSELPALSPDGRHVAFVSWATNLVPGDTNGTGDVFVKDRLTGGVERVSVAADGAQANNVSGAAALSADGRYVAFVSWASNLVPGDTNGAADVFVKDRQSGAIERVSVAAGGGQANGASGVGVSAAEIRSGRGDQASAAGPRAGALVAGDTGPQSVRPSVSADGRYVGFSSTASNLVPGDLNGAADVFVKDRQTGAIERVSVAPDGADADAGSYYVALRRVLRTSLDPKRGLHRALVTTRRERSVQACSGAAPGSGRMVEAGRDAEQPGQIGTRLVFVRLLGAAEESRARDPAEGETVVAVAQPGPFAHPEHRDVVLFEELADALLARLAHVRRGRVGIDVVRVDLERDQVERAERCGLDDRHVVRRAERRAGHVGAGARPEVAQLAGPDAPPDWLQERVALERVEQAEAVAAPDE